jgi:D-alanyl-D-alanine carboxypeptidase
VIWVRRKQIYFCEGGSTENSPSGKSPLGDARPAGCRDRQQTAAERTEVEKVRAALDAWLVARAPVDKVTGVAAYISFGDAGPAIEAFAGKVGRNSGAGPVDQDTIYHMGSTSKSFTVAVILTLEAAGKLSIDDPLGKWLPAFPAWKDITIRRLLNMTSGIPNYSETEWMSRAWANEPKRDFTFKELVDAAYPSATNKLPVKEGYFYSNTNYILAGMIAEKAAGKSYRDLVHQLVIDPHGLYSTFYESGTCPESVIARLSHGSTSQSSGFEIRIILGGG